MVLERRYKRAVTLDMWFDKLQDSNVVALRLKRRKKEGRSGQTSPRMYALRATYVVSEEDVRPGRWGVHVEFDD